MPETAICRQDYDTHRRADQDAFANQRKSQDRWEAADKAGVFADENHPVLDQPQRKGNPICI